jgi:hypothetical protein
MKLVVNPAEALAADVSIDLGGGDLAVAEHHLNGAKVRPVLEKMSGEGVPQDMRMDFRLEAGLPGMPFQHFPKSLPGERLSPPGQEQLVRALF